MAYSLGENLSFLTPESRPRFQRAFESCNPQNGTVSAEGAKQFMLASKLPGEVLQAIWNLCDIERRGRLTFAEFALALYFIDLKRRGGELYTYLPDTLMHQLMMYPAPPNTPFEPQPVFYVANPQSLNPNQGLPAQRPRSASSNLPSATPSPPPAAPTPNPVQSNVAPQGSWTMKHQDKERFRVMFQRLDAANSGFITYGAALSFFVTTHLPPEEIKQIIKLSDISSTGKLNADEFCVAAHLVNLRRGGRAVPSKLPTELIPESHRAIQNSLNDLKKSIIADISKPKAPPVAANAPPSNPPTEARPAQPNPAPQSKQEPSKKSSKAEELRRRLEAKRQECRLLEAEMSTFEAEKAKKEANLEKVKESAKKAAENVQQALNAKQARQQQVAEGRKKLEQAAVTRMSLEEKVASQVAIVSAMQNENKEKISKLYDPKVAEIDVKKREQGISAAPPQDFSQLSEEERIKAKAHALLQKRMSDLRLLPDGNLLEEEAKLRGDQKAELEKNHAEEEDVGKIRSQFEALKFSRQHDGQELKMAHEEEELRRKEAEAQERERFERERLEAERIEKERLEKEREEKERVERELLEQRAREEALKEQEERERLEREAKEREEQERIEREERERREQEDRQRKEQEERERRAEEEKAKSQREEMQKKNREIMMMLEKEKAGREEKLRREREERQRQEREEQEREQQAQLVKAEQEKKSQEEARAQELQEKLRQEALLKEQHEREQRLFMEKEQQEREEAQRKEQEEKLRKEREVAEMREMLEKQRKEQEDSAKREKESKEREEKARREEEARREKERMGEETRLERERVAREQAQQQERDEAHRQQQQQLEEQEAERVRKEAARLMAEKMTQERLAREELERKSAKKVRALYDYTAEIPEDLTFTAGAILTVLEENGEWWRGRLEDGTEGMFPFTYIEPYVPSPSSGTPASAPTPVVAAPTPSRVPTPVAVPQPTYISQGVVLFDYQPQREGDVKISVNERVMVVEKTPEGWCLGDTGNGRGWFPLTYIREEPYVPPSPAASGLISPSSSVNPAPGVKPPQVGLSPAARQALAAKGQGGANAPPPVAPSPAAAAGKKPVPKIPPKVPSKSQASRSYLSQDERKRQEGIAELIQTEEIYIKKLAITLNLFYPKLAQRLSPEDMKTIFSTTGEIYEVSKRVCTAFLQRQANSPPFQIERIGDIVLSFLPSLAPYRTYCSNQFRSIALFSSLMKNDVRFAAEVKALYQDKSFKEANGITFEAFLLEPMQRITRYPILLKPILHRTPKEHVDHQDLVDALTRMESFVAEVNEATRHESDLAKLKELQGKIDFQTVEEKIDLCSDTRSLGPRRILHDGLLLKAKSGRKLQAFLFNDMLLLTQHHTIIPVGGFEYSVYCEPIPVHALLARDPPGEGSESVHFQILRVQTQDIINVKAPNLSEKRRWMREIDSAFSHYQNVLKKQKLKVEGVNPTIRYLATLQVTILEGRGLALPDTDTNGRCDPYCHVEVEDQVQKTKVASKTLNPKWNTHLFFSISTIDQVLKFVVYDYDQFSRDNYIGEAEISLNFLEYYGEKETEKISLSLQSGKKPAGHVDITLSYNPLY